MSDRKRIVLTEGENGYVVENARSYSIYVFKTAKEAIEKMEVLLNE